MGLESDTLHILPVLVRVPATTRRCFIRDVERRVSCVWRFRNFGLIVALDTGYCPSDMARHNAHDFVDPRLKMTNRC